MKILAKPKQGKINKRNNILYKHIEEEHHAEVYELNLFTFLTNRFDIFHMHWPDRVFSYSLPMQFLLLPGLYLFLTLLKIIGTKIIYTVHNPHIKADISIRKLKNIYYSIIKQRVDGYILPSKNSEIIFKLTNKSAAEANSEIIPLGVQKEILEKGYQPPIELINFDRKYILQAGRISCDKKFHNGITELRKINQFNDLWVINAGSNECEKDVKALLEIEKIKENKVLNIIRYLEDNEFNHLVKNCVFVLISYEPINSGFATLAISLNKPIYSYSKKFLDSLYDEYNYDQLFYIKNNGNIEKIGQISKLKNNDNDMIYVANRTFQFYKRVLK